MEMARGASEGEVDGLNQMFFLGLEWTKILRIGFVYQGLLNAVEQELPQVEHRMCARHIYANLKKNHSAKSLKAFFWKLAQSYNNAEYEENCEAFKKFNNAAFEDLMKTNPRHWCQAFFKTHSCCGDVHNNMAESFNRSILYARTRPMVEMLEMIRRQTMQRIDKRCSIAEEYTGKHSLKVADSLRESQKKAGYCVSYPSSYGRFEVDDSENSVIVSTTQRTCTCRRWDLTGIPCCHAMCVIMDRRMNVEEYISDYFLTSRWRDTYKNNISPVSGFKFWKKSSEARVIPPEVRNLPGRPKKFHRIKHSTESPKKKGKLTKHGRILRCSRCRQTGHNVRKCQRSRLESSEGSSRGSFSVSQVLLYPPSEDL